MERTRKHRLRTVGVGVLVASMTLVGGAWTWPFPPSPPKPPTSPTGGAKLVIQGPDPLVLEILDPSYWHPLVIKNTANVNDSGGFSVSISGSASVGISTGTCSRPLTKKGTAGDSCTMQLRVLRSGQPGQSKLTIKGGPKSTGDTLTIKTVDP